MSRPIPAGDYVEHFDPELPHHRAWLLAALEQLVAHEPQALEEGGTLRHLWTARQTAAVDGQALVADIPAAIAVALPLVREFEACRLTAYPDPETGAEPWTIGWGSTTYNDRTSVKAGDTISQEMAGVDVLRRANQQREIDWSGLPAAGATLADLNPSERDRLRAAVKRHKGEESLLELGDEELDLALGLITMGTNGSLVPTHAGLLLLGQVSSLRRSIPGHEVAFQVLQGTDVRVNHFQRGPLLAVVEDLSQRLGPFVQEEELEVGMFRVPIPNLPASCFREAFINALAHRDYTALAAVHVQWQLGDNLVISNPGGFVRGVSIVNLLTAPPRSRNPVLADALKRIGLAERTGRGVDRIFEGLLETGRPAPSYARSSDDDIVVELSTRPANLKLVAIWQVYQQRHGQSMGLLCLLVLNLLHDQRKLTVEQLSEQLQRDPTLVRRHVEQLLESGLVASQGQGRGRAYTLSQRVHAAFDREDAYQFQATLRPEEIDRRILDLATGLKTLRRKDVMEALGGLDERQASYALKRLCVQGRLVPFGSGKGRHYQLPP